MQMDYVFYLSILACYIPRSLESMQAQFEYLFCQKWYIFPTVY